MTNPNLTELVCVIDRSGSMSAIKHDAEGGFNAFINESKSLPGKVRVTLAQFDAEYELLWNALDIREVPRYSLCPRGTTALLDAIGRTLSAVGDRFAALPEHERPGKVVIMIVTDGQENASREFSRERIREMISHQTSKYSWQFAYLGSNQDSFAEGANIGIRRDSCMNWTFSGGGMRSAYSSASRSVNCYVNNVTSNLDLNNTPNLVTTTATIAKRDDATNQCPTN